MKVVVFIEPPQSDVIEKTLRHCGLGCASPPRGPRPTAIRSTTRRATGATPVTHEPEELPFVDEDTFWATF